MSVVFDKNTKTGELRNIHAYLTRGGKRRKIYIPLKHKNDARLIHLIGDTIKQINDLREDERFPSRLQRDLEVIRQDCPKVFAKIENAGATGVRKIYIKDIADDFLQYKRGQVGDVTYYQLEVYLPVIGDFYRDNLLEYTTQDISRITNTLTKNDNSPYAHTSKKTFLRWIKEIYAWLILQNMCKDNPAIGVKVKKIQSDVIRQQTKIDITDEYLDLQEDFYFRKGRLKILCLIKVLRAFGCRAGEIRHIHIKNVDFGGRTIRRGFSKRYDKPRQVPMTPEQIETIKWVNDIYPKFWEWTQQDNIAQRVAHLLAKYVQCDCNAIRRYVSLKLTHKYGPMTESQLLGHTVQTASSIYQRSNTMKDLKIAEILNN